MSSKRPINVYNKLHIPSEMSGFYVDDEGDLAVDILNQHYTHKGEHTSLDSKGVATTQKISMSEKEVSGRVMVATGNNLYGQLKQMMPFLQEGPYIAEGRDNELTIHNRNFNQRPILSFTYRGGNGDLLSFSAHTNFKTKATDAVTNAQIDEEENDFHVTNLQQNIGDDTEGVGEEEAPDTSYDVIGGWRYYNDPKIKNPPYPPLPRTPKLTSSKEAKEKYLEDKFLHTRNIHTKKDIEEFQQGFKAVLRDKQEYIEEVLKPKYNELVEGVKTGDPEAIEQALMANQLPDFIVHKDMWIAKWVNPVSYWEKAMLEKGVPENVLKQSTTNYYNRWKTGYKYLREHPSIKFVTVVDDLDGKDPELIHERGYGMVYIAEYKTVKVPIEASRILSQIGPEDFVTEYVTNKLEEANQKQLEASATIVGYPGLECGRIISIQGVPRKYSGNWYITEITHTISSSGYLCNLSLIKPPSPSLITEAKTTTSTKSLYTSVAELAQEKVEKGTKEERLREQARVEFKAYIKKEKEAAIERGEDPDAIDEESYNIVIDPSTSNIQIFRAEEDIVNMKDVSGALKKQLKR